MHTTRLLATVVMLLFVVHSAYALHFVAYGDTRGRTEHAKLLPAINALEPELIINTGDIFGATGSNSDVVAFKGQLGQQPWIKSLVEANKYLVCHGNHEPESAILTFTPPIVRGQSVRYSFTEGNCFFVTLNLWSPDTDESWVRQQLQSTAARAAQWRFLFAHTPVYSSDSRSHASGKDWIERVCDDLQVAVHFAGHDHFYERSYLIYDNSVVNRGDNITQYERGTVYMVTGGGGASLYDVDSDWWTAESKKLHHFVEVDAGDNALTLRAKRADNSVFDMLTLQRAGTPVQSPAPTYQAKPYAPAEFSSEMFDIAGRSVHTPNGRAPVPGVVLTARPGQPPRLLVLTGAAGD